MSTIGVKVTADTAQLQTGMSQARRSIEGLKKSVDDVSKAAGAISKVAGIIGGFSAGFAVLGRFKSMIDSITDSTDSGVLSAKQWSREFDKGLDSIKKNAVSAFGSVQEVLKGISLLTITGSASETAEILKNEREIAKKAQERLMSEQKIAEAKRDSKTFADGIKALDEAEHKNYLEKLSDEERLLQLKKDQKKAIEDSNNAVIEGNKLNQLEALKKEQAIRFDIEKTQARILEAEKKITEEKLAQEKKNKEALRDAYSSEDERGTNLRRAINEDKLAQEERRSLSFASTGLGSVGGGRNVGAMSEAKQTERQQQMAEELRKSNEYLNDILKALRSGSKNNEGVMIE